MIFEYECDATRFLERFVARGSDSMREVMDRLFDSSFSLEEFDSYAEDVWEGECSEDEFYDWLRWDTDKIFREMEKRYNKKEKNDGKVEEETSEGCGDHAGSGTTEG